MPNAKGKKNSNLFIDLYIEGQQGSTPKNEKKVIYLLLNFLLKARSEALKNCQAVYALKKRVNRNLNSIDQ